VNALLVNAGRRVELLELLRAACKGRVVAVDIDPIAPTLYYADVAAEVPQVANRGFVDRLLDLCREHSVRLAVPTTDRELEVLAEHVDDFAGVGTRVAIGPHRAVVAAQDKLACAAALIRAGIAPVPTEIWRADRAPSFEFPVVVKPRGGSAAEGVRVITRLDQWTAPPDGEERWLVQPRVPGAEVTLDALASDDGRVVCLGARRRLKVRGGEVERAITVDAEPFLELTTGVAGALSLSGPFNFQVFVDTEPPLIGEVNPRLGGGLPLSEHADLQLLESLCTWAASGRWRNGPVLARPGVYMTRHDRSVFLEAAGLAW
jgi:carbamoyl-phosphate synthase large subunit